MMSQVRVLGSTVAVALLAGCSTQSTNTVPRPIAPQEGPRASVYTRFSGGMLNRRVETTFSVDQSAYVLVGHVSADGTIEILYPESPADVRPVKGSVRLRARPFSTSIDGTSRMFRTATYRATAAKFDSYDGSGDGFVFAIASRLPMNYQAYALGRGWDTMSIDDYYSTWDPRLGVRDFADELVPAAYSISYARAYTSVRYADYASFSDCSMFDVGSPNVPWMGFLSGGMSWWSPFTPTYVLMGPVYTTGWNALNGGCRRQFQFASLSRQTFIGYTPQLGPTPPAANPRTPKTTRAWTDRRPTNPRTLAYRRGGDDGWGSRAHEATTRPWSGSDWKATLPSTPNTPNNSGANGSTTSAQAPAVDRQGNSPKTKQ